MRNEMSVLRSPVISETGMFSNPKESVPDQTGRGMAAPSIQGHRGVVAQATVAVELGDLPGGVGVVADVGPGQRRAAADAAPVVGHVRLDLAPGLAGIQAGGHLPEHPRPRATLVLLMRMRMRQPNDHGGPPDSGPPIEHPHPFPPRETNFLWPQISQIKRGLVQPRRPARRESPLITLNL